MIIFGGSFQGNVNRLDSETVLDKEGRGKNNVPERNAVLNKLQTNAQQSFNTLQFQS